MKKFKIIIFLVFISINGGWSQSPVLIDSLKQFLNNDELSDSSRVFILLNICYHSRNDPVHALQYGRKALSLAKKCGLKQLEAYAYMYIGNSERRLGNKLNGIEALICSANIFRSLDEIGEEAGALTAIGIIFMNNNDLKNSIKYYQQGLSLYKKKRDTIFIANTQINIGEAYRISGILDSAEFYYNFALKNFNFIQSADQQKINEGKSTIAGNLGMIYLQQGKLDQAQNELTRALSFFRQKNDPYRTSIYQSEMGKLLILKGNAKEGEQLINESLKMAREAQLKDQIRDFNLQLSAFYEKQNQFEKALFHYKQYKAYDDSLKNVENVRKLEQQQSQFEISKREEKIKTLNRINRLQRKVAYILSGSALLFLILMAVLFQANQKIKKNNKEILKQKLLVEQREQEKALLLRELNHRVKNNLQMVASLLSLQAHQLKGHPAAEALMAGKYRVEALTLIHQKLYRDDIDTKIDIKNYIEELTENLVMNFGQQFQLKLNLNSLIMKIDKAIPLGLVINELVTNSLKYGANNNNLSVLSISIHDDDKNIYIEIGDNGKGLPDGFDFRQSNSFGLKLVHSLMKQLYGEIDCTSGAGTHWKLVLNKLKIS